MLDSAPHLVERLGEHDLTVLARLDGAGVTAEDVRDLLRRTPEAIESYVSDPRLFTLVFEVDESDAIQVLSPSLAFAVLVYRTIRDLGSATHVPEWVGAGERLPVFDVGTLLEFSDHPAMRYMVIDLLSSFTRVASGSMWVRTRRGYRRRRFSELDPVSLAEMVESLPAAQRPAGYSRLGDVALFLTGVFPDHTARHPASEMARARLARSIGGGEDWLSGEYLHFLETAGRSWYGRAAETALLPAVHKSSLQDLSANFTQARRFLNYLADTYLHQYETGLMNPVA